MFGQEEEPLLDEQKPPVTDEKSGSGKDDGKDGDDPVRELREELKQLRGRLSETEQNAKFWYEKASGKSTANETADEDEEEEKFDEDLVDVISSNDPKKVKTALRKLGFVSEKDVQKRITQTREQIAAETELFGAYPDLKDQDSELFTTTSKEYARLAKKMGDSQQTLAIAAELAAAKIGYEAPAKGGRRRNDDDEEDRVQRVNSQQGSRGRNTRTRSEGPEEFSDAQRSIIAKFQSAGSSLTPEVYRDRANKGVRMGARNAGMRRG